MAIDRRSDPLGLYAAYEENKKKKKRPVFEPDLSRRTMPTTPETPVIPTTAISTPDLWQKSAPVQQVVPAKPFVPQVPATEMGRYAEPDIIKPTVMPDVVTGAAPTAKQVIENLKAKQIIPSIPTTPTFDYEWKWEYLRPPTTPTDVKEKAQIDKTPPDWFKRLMSGKDIFGIQAKRQEMLEEGWEPTTPQALEEWSQRLRAFERTKPGQYLLRMSEMAGQIAAPGKSVYEEMPSTGNEALDFTADIIGVITGYMVPGGIGRMGYEIVSPATNMVMGRLLTGKVGERVLRTMASQKVLQELGPVPSPLKDIVGRVAARAVIGGLTSGINFSGRRLLLDALQLQGIPDAKKIQEIAKNLTKDFGWGFLTGAVLGGGRAIIKEASPYFNKESMVRQGYREIKDPATKKGLDIYWRETRVQKGERPSIEFVVVKPTEETLQARIDYLYKYSQTEWAQTPRGREMIARIKDTVDAYEIGKTGAFAIIPEAPYTKEWPMRAPRPEVQEKVQRLQAVTRGEIPPTGQVPTTATGLYGEKVELPYVGRRQQAPSKFPEFKVLPTDVGKLQPMTAPIAGGPIISPSQLRQLVREGTAKSTKEINDATILAYQKAVEQGLGHKEARSIVQNIVDTFRQVGARLNTENVAKYFENINAGMAPAEAVKMVAERPDKIGPTAVYRDPYQMTQEEYVAKKVKEGVSRDAAEREHYEAVAEAIRADRVVTPAAVASYPDLEKILEEKIAKRTEEMKAVEIAKAKPEVKPEPKPAEVPAKEPWQMTRKEYMAKGIIPLPVDHPLQVKAENAIKALKEAKKKLLDVSPHKYGDDAIEKSLRSTKVPREIKEAYNIAKKEYRSAVNAVEQEADHKTLVERALAEGKPIPPEVLADYPDLKPVEAPARTIDDLNLGRSGKAALKKWAANERIMVDLDKPDDPDTKLFVEFFNKYYQAGLEGVSKRNIPFDEVDTGFPPFLADEFYEAGEKDAARTKPKEEPEKPAGEPGKPWWEKDVDWTTPEEYKGEPGIPIRIRPVVSSTGKGYSLMDANGVRFGTIRESWEEAVAAANKENRRLYEAEQIRLKAIQEKEKQEAPAPTEKTPSGITWRLNDEKGGVEIKFPERPDDAIIQRLRNAGFRWSKPQKLWYAKQSDARIALAKELAGEQEKPEVKEPSKKELKPPEDSGKMEAEKVPVPEGRVADNIDWLKGAASDARKRLAARRAKREAEAQKEEMPEELSFAVGKAGGLPMDDLVDYAIVGAELLATENPSYDEWAEVMLEEFGPAIKLFLRGIYGQSKAMLEMTPAEINEMVGITQREEVTGLEDRREPDGTQRGEEALERVPSEDVQRTEGERGARPDRKESDKADDRGHRKTARPGTDVRTGVGDDEKQLDVPAEREGGTGAGHESPDPEITTPGRSITSENYRIRPEDQLDTRSKLQKLNDNIRAIRLMKDLVERNQPATPEEQAILIKYVGWGFYKDVFDKSYAEKHGLMEQYNALKELLTEEEFMSARATTPFAHYTSPEIINAMYEVLQRIGFDGGRILEPAMGIGHFFGMMPENLAKKSWLTGVEIDTVSGNIAKLLYPRANINVMGYEEFDVPYDKRKLLNENYYDLAISNVPFNRTPPAKDVRYKNIADNLHNFFFAKAVDQVRPGGIVAFVTSRYTMDSRDRSFREYLNERADFLGAVRLHNEAFKGIAETQVVTDIIFLRKRAVGEPYAGEEWLENKDVTVEKNREAINEYYVDHPEMVMGETAFIRGMYYAGEYAVVPDGRDLAQSVIDALTEKLPRNAYKQRPVHEATEAPKIEDFLIAPPETQEGSIVIQKNKLMIAQLDDNGQLVLMPADKVLNFTPGGTVEKRIRGMIKIRDIYNELLNLELSDGSEAEIEKLRKTLNKVYDDFVKNYGYINTAANSRAFAEDNSYYRIAGLEVQDPETGKYVKNDVFKKRTVRKYETKTSAENSKEGLLITLNERGVVDINHIASLTGKTSDQVAEELTGFIFKDPEKGWVTADEYLSGNVRQKLRIAEDAAKHDKSYEANVKALKEVQPADLTPDKIYVKLGVPWIGKDDVRDFLVHLLDIKSWEADEVRVTHETRSGIWGIDFKDKGVKTSVRNSTANRKTWGFVFRGFDTSTGRSFTIEKSALDIIESLLNSRSLNATFKRVTYDPVEGREKEKTVTHQAATLALREKGREIEQEFKEWLWSDSERAERLAKVYNWEFNNSVMRNFDGSHLTFPGMNPAITLGPHQKDMVWRIVQSRGALAHHVAGSGKTFVMVASAMEMKRLGIANKPIVVTRPSIIGQFAAEARRLYPAAKILAYSQKDMAADKRKKALARIAAGDWDLVIMPHSSFKMVPLSGEYVERIINRELANLERSIQEQRRALGQEGKAIVRKMENARNALEKKLREHLAKLERQQDAGFMTFEESGIDALFVDESHYYKNLFYNTSMNNIGNMGSPQGSMQAFDMFTKTDYVRNLRDGSGIVFASGTPISNSMVEMYALLRYLAPQELEARDLHSFDAWASVFGRAVTASELNPSGKGFRPKVRFAQFVNLPELLQLYHSFADVVNHERFLELNPHIKLPKIATGQRILISAQPSEEIMDYIEELDDRCEAIKAGHVDPSEDNFLKVVNDGRLVALYPPLRGLMDYKDSRINLAINNIFDIWKKYEKDRLTQLAFLDLSVPKGKSKEQEEADIDEEAEDVVFEDLEEDQQTVYEVIRRKLLAKGVPADEIAFIHDYKTDKQRLELFEKVKRGDIRILLGSTSKMGEGMNVQDKVIAVHHLDCPWKPSEIEQRERRGIRQGNQNEEVFIYTYGTERTFDIFMWQLISIKQKNFKQVETRNINPEMREMENFDEIQMSSKQMSAILTGDPKYMEYTEIEQRLIELAAIESGYIGKREAIKREISSASMSLEGAKKVAEKSKQDLERAKNIKGDLFEIKLFDKVYKDRKEAGKIIQGVEGPLKNVFHKYDKFRQESFYTPKQFLDEINKLQGINAHLFNAEKYKEGISEEELNAVIIPLGEFAGFPLSLRLHYQYGGALIFEGSNFYKVLLGETGYNTIRSLEIRAQGIKKDYTDRVKFIESLTKRLEELKAEAAKPFKYADELKKLRRRKEELAQELGIDQLEGEVMVEDAYVPETYGVGVIEISLMIDGIKQKVEVTGKEVAPGIAINKGVKNEKKDIRDLWRVTHLQSGLRFGTYYDTMQTAEKAALAISKLADWNVPLSDISNEIKQEATKLAEDFSKKEQQAQAEQELEERSYDIFLNRTEYLSTEVSAPAKELRHAPERTSQKQKAGGLTLLVKLVDRGVIERPAFHFDVGGGRYDLGIEYLKENGIECILWDPEARSPEYNKASLERLKQVGGAETASLNNVLNVLPDKESRLDAIRFMFQHLQTGGLAIITVHQGDKTGVSKKVVVGNQYNWQLNRPLESYLPEIKEALGNAANIEMKYNAFLITKKRRLDLTRLAKRVSAEKAAAEKAEEKAEKELLKVHKEPWQEELDDSMPEVMHSIAKKDARAFAKATGAREGETGKQAWERVTRKQDILRKIDRVIATYKGHVRGPMAGFFRSKEKYIRIKTKFFADLEILAHELGHFLDGELKLFSKRNINKVMGEKAFDSISQELVLNSPYVQETLLKVRPEASFKLQVHEGIADFINFYINEPEKAKELMPGFYEYFDKMIHTQSELLDKVEEIRAIVDKYYRQPDIALVNSFIGSEKEKTISWSKVKDWWEQVYYNIFDDSARIAYYMEQLYGGRKVAGEGATKVVDPEKNAWLMYRMAKGAQMAAHNFIRRGGGQIEYGTKKKIGPSLYEITDPIHQMGKDEDGVPHFVKFTAYLVSKMAIYREDELGVISGMDKAQLEAARRLVKEVEASKYFKKYDKAREEMRDFCRFVLRQLVRGGILSEEGYETIIKKYPDIYIPFYRVRDDRKVKKSEGQHIANISKGVITYKGAMLPIQDPWQSIIRQTHIFTILADKNLAMQALVDMEQIAGGTGEWFSSIPTPVKVTKATIGELLTMLGIDVDDSSALDVLGELLNEAAQGKEVDMGTLVNIFRPERFGDVRKNVVMVWREGKPQFYEFKDKQLFNAIMHIDSETAGWFVDTFLRPAAKLLRIGATWNPRFLGFNAWRDAWQTPIYSEYQNLPLLGLFKGLYHIAKNDEVYRDFLADRAGMSTQLSYDKDYLTEGYHHILRSRWQEMMKIAINPIGLLGRASSMIEYATNVGEYMAARRKGAHWITGSFAGRDITVDHQVHGSKTAIIRGSTPFFNAAIRGHDKMRRAFQKNPARFILRALLILTLPTVLLYLLNRNNPYYQELPEWRKNLFWNYPLPVGGSFTRTKWFLTVPRPFLMGIIFGAFPENLMRQLDKKNRASWNNLSEDLLKTAVPNYMPAAIGPILEQWGNLRFYNDAPVVPASEAGRAPEFQYGAYTSEVAKLLGKKLKLSPRRIDALIQGYTAGVGRHVIRAVDELLYLTGVADRKLRPKGTIQDIPVLGDIIATSGAYGSASVDRFYKDLNRAEVLAAREQSYLERGQTPPKLSAKDQALLWDLEYMRSLQRELAGVRSIMREIHESADYTPEEKRKLLDFYELTIVNQVRVHYSLQPIPIE